MERIAAIVLAGGSGKRMNSSVHKQYMTLAGKPVLYYAIKAFEESEAAQIIVVVGAGETAYCREEIVDRYGFKKVCAVVEGGKERFHSVHAGLAAVVEADYVLIHDGARPFVTADMITRSLECVRQGQPCVVGMPVKDTIKVVDRDGLVRETPDRNTLWQIQTPQTFPYPLIKKAYDTVAASGNAAVTDDAMVLELASGQRVKVIEGDYRNLKITTPEDLLTAETYFL